MSATPVISTDDLTREQWLEARRDGIGGSDAAAILGLDPFKTPLAVYLDKTGELPDDEPGEAAAWGIRLEDVVADAAVDHINEQRQADGLEPVKARRRNAILAHPERPWMLANIDRETVGYEGGPGILEVKTTGHWAAQTWEDDGDTLPDRYHVQTQHYLAVTGRDHGWIAVLVAGQRLVVEPVERDQELIDALVEVEEAFWKRVANGDPPPAGPADEDILKAVYPEARAATKVLLPDEARDLIAQRNAAKAAENAAKDRRKEAENRLRQLIGDAEEAWLPGDNRPAFTYREINRTSLDSKALTEAHPDIAEEFTTASSYRRFHFNEEG